MAMRKIVKIDDNLCNGCGECVPSCAEGAIQIIDGKARLVADNLCDGIGNCLGTCPQDAITIEERDSAEFDEVAVEKHLTATSAPPAMPCGCPSANVVDFNHGKKGQPTVCSVTDRQTSHLSHWPVKIELVPPSAPFLRGANLVFAADCVPVAYPNFHEDFLKGNAVIIACPKLNDQEDYIQRLTSIFQESGLKSITVVHMEVPCCFGLMMLVKEALKRSGKKIPIIDRTISVRGEEL